MPIDRDEPYSPEPFRERHGRDRQARPRLGRIAQNVTEASRTFQSETGVPFIQGLPETVRALQNLVRYAAALTARHRAAPRAARPR